MRGTRASDDGPTGAQGIGQSAKAAVVEQLDDRTECQFCGRKFNE